MKKTILLLSVITVVFTACKKDKVDNQTTSSEDDGLAESLFGDVKRVSEEAANDEGATTKVNPYSFGDSTVTITIVPAWTDTATWPKILTIDFGSTNVVGSYGISRRGKLTITLSDRFRNSGSVLTIVPTNYYVNDYKLEGTKTLSNNGRNTSGNLSYSVLVENGKVTFPTSEVITWHSERTAEWIAGEGTTLFSDGLAGICDDVYSVTGSGYGVNRKGVSYIMSITSPLRKEICWRWIVSGKIDLVPSGLATRSIDFGDGTRDAKAAVTVNGTTVNVTMK